MSPVPSAKDNQLLAALPQSEYQVLLPDLEFIPMPTGKVVYESGAAIAHVYFPATSVVSLIYVLETGASAEISVVGSEGLVGIALFMGGGGSTPSQAVVQSAGHGYRLRSAVVRSQFEKSGALMDIFLRYTQALITQMSQTAACNRHHTLDQQLCRWLLRNLDRRQGAHLEMTQESIANLLGVRREGVTDAALKLQRAGLIRYTRGKIEILDRAGIERRSCECYEVVKKEYERLLPARHTTRAAMTENKSRAPLS
jgi:CRP-like cAMP-binding protein